MVASMYSVPDGNRRREASSTRDAECEPPDRTVGSKRLLAVTQRALKFGNTLGQFLNSTSLSEGIVASAESRMHCTARLARNPLI